MTVEIIAALKAIPALVDAVKSIAKQVENLSIAMTERNISNLKSEVNSYLVQLGQAKSSDERKRLIQEISKALSK